MRTITFLKRGNNGCTHYRVEIPARFLRKNGFQVNIINSISEIDFLNVKDKIFIFGRACTYSELDAFRKLKQLGAIVVYEIDDDLLELPSWNQASLYFLRVQVVIRDFLREASHVIVTTKNLRQNFLLLNRNISVIDNYIDFDYLSENVAFEILDKENKKIDLSVLRNRFLIFWGGSITHREDLKILEKQLPIFLKKHPEVGLVAVHCLNKKIYNEISNDQLFLIPAVLPDKYLALLNQIPASIGLAPLVNHSFNFCKSRLKIIEYMAAQMAPFASNFGPYAETLNNTPFQNFLCNGQDWLPKLEDIYAHSEFSILKESVLTYAQEHFDIKQSNWITVLSKV